MPDMTPRRLRLWGERGQLARVDESALDEGRRRLSRRHDDIELAYIEQRAADSIDIVLLVPASFRSDDFSEIATILRAALGIGSGPHALIGDDTGEIRASVVKGERVPVAMDPMVPTFPAARMTVVSPAWPIPRTRGRSASCGGLDATYGRLADRWPTWKASRRPAAWPPRCSRVRASRWSRWFYSRQSRLVAGRNVPLLLFVAAGLAQIFAVQSVIWTRRYMVTPDELKQWLPDDFTDHGERPTQWLQLFQRYNDERARRWARRTRAWINAGITLLLVGIAVGVVPPEPVSSVRWLVITVAWSGVAVEASWVAAMALDEQARVGMLMRFGAIVTAGGATVAVGFAAAAGASGGAATWWATGLTLAAIPLWLAACMDASLRQGRVRVGAPLRGGWSIARVALAPVAPAVFVLALWSAVGELVKEHHQTLQALHAGVEELLPKGVSLGAHHRAWSRCSTLPVASRDDLVELLDESSRLLGPGSAA